MMFVVKECINEARFPNVTLNDNGIVISNKTGVSENLVELIYSIFENEPIDIIIKRHKY